MYALVYILKGLMRLYCLCNHGITISMSHFKIYLPTIFVGFKGDFFFYLNALLQKHQIMIRRSRETPLINYMMLLLLFLASKTCVSRNTNIQLRLIVKATFDETKHSWESRWDIHNALKIRKRMIIQVSCIQAYNSHGEMIFHHIYWEYPTNRDVVNL